MGINVNLDAKQIEQYVANAVLESALGDAVRKAVDDEIKKMNSSWNGSLLQRAIGDHIHDIVLKVIRDEYGDVLRAAVREKITDELVGEVTEAALDGFLERLRR